MLSQTRRTRILSGPSQHVVLHTSFSSFSEIAISRLFPSQAALLMHSLSALGVMLVSELRGITLFVLLTRSSADLLPAVQP